MSTTIVSAMDNNHGKGLSLLSLDAGGPQGISQMQILVNVMESVSRDCNGNPEERVKRPCDVFSLVGGVGTGGLIAIFLVFLKLTAKQALEEFTSFVIEAFGEVNPNPGKQTEKLNLSIETILRKYNINKDDKLITPGSPEHPCKLVVPIMYKNHVGVPCVLRNYIARHEPPTNLTIAEAMLATCATPPMFTPTIISKDFAMFEYVGGGLGLSNPIREIVAEAHHAFGDEATIACLLSIGCGHPGANTVPSDPTATTWTGFLERLVMDSEKTAREVATHLARLSLYYRLSVRYGLEGHHSRASGDPEAITTHTTTYLQDLETIEIVGRCVDTIMTGDGFTTLEQLSKRNSQDLQCAWLRLYQDMPAAERFFHHLDRHLPRTMWSERSQWTSWRNPCSMKTGVSKRVEENYGDRDWRLQEDPTCPQVR